ncbi:MAG: P1 family peptidase, partial [Pyrinomonadaceae bacterium]
MKTFLLAITLLLAALSHGTGQTHMQNQSRPRAREAGIVVGILPAGSLNAITDVAGVRVGHTTIIRGDNIRTG